MTENKKNEEQSPLINSLNYIRKEEPIMSKSPAERNKNLHDFSFEIKTSEINMRLQNRKSDKVEISDGSKMILSLFDCRRILRFDLERRLFKIIDFADFGNFNANFTLSGSIYLNINNGLLIVTGENHDQLFHYSSNKHTMNQLAKLNNNHSNGSMIYNAEGNSVICLSGWQNKTVEKYVNDEIISNFYKKPINDFKKVENQLKNTWSHLPELSIERSEASFVIFDNYIYSFFGFNYPQLKCLDSIERLNLESPLMWEMVDYKNNNNVSNVIKSHASIKINDNEVLFLGGSDGLNDCPVENFSFYNTKNEFYIHDRKFPGISNKHIFEFQKNNSSVPYYDNLKRSHLATIDEKYCVHILEANTLQYEIFSFY